jgi:hypothetical protein
VTVFSQILHPLQPARVACFFVTLAALVFVPLPTHGQATKKSPVPKNSKAHRDGRVWGALFFATPEKIEAPQGADAAKTLSQLGKAFPEKSFQLLGEHTQEIFSEYESWVVPSKDLFLKIDSKGPTENNDGVNLHLQLWQEKNVLLKTDVILRKEPIFIAGPRWGKGQLIMVIELR